MHPFILVVVFIVAAVVGYFLIKQVPTLLHTPLMSGMNALSGVTVIGALSAAGLAFLLNDSVLAQCFGGIAIVLAMVNVVGGFGVTHRMLRMFKGKNKKK